MKPIIACVLLCLVLAGCGSSPTTNAPRGSTSPAAESPSTPAPAPSPAPDPAPTPTPSPSPAPAPSPSPAPNPSPAPPPPAPAPAPAPKPAHVMLLVEENRSFSTIYPAGMPYLSSLGEANGIATNYFSDEPGSLRDYLWLSSGSGEDNFGCDGNLCTAPITDDNIFREMIKNGVSWKVYADSLPYAGFMGDYSGNYVKRHNPAAWYSDIISDPEQQQNIVPFSQLATDLANNTLPNYSFVVPDLQHDAHDGTPAMADAWLQQNLAPVLSTQYFQAGGDGVMFITFDNGDGDSQGQVFMAVIGPGVIPGVKVGTAFRHENTLRTMMDMLLLTNLPGASATASPMSEFFQ